MSAGPSIAQRLVLGLAAVVVLVLGLAAVLVMFVSMEPLRPDAFDARTFDAMPLVLVATLLVSGALLGQAVVPLSVVERAQRTSFSVATALAALAIACATPSPMALFTWPLGVVVAIIAVLFFRRAGLLGARGGRGSRRRDS